MKTIIAAVCMLIGIIIGSNHQQPVCMDPSANIPIDCSLVK